MTTPPPGWLPDPSVLELERYWDGARWTERTRDTVTGIEYAPRAPLTAPADAGWPAVTPPSHRPAARGRRSTGLGRIVVVGLVAIAASAALLIENPLSRALGTSAYRADVVVDALTAPTVEPAPREVDYPTYGTTQPVRYLEAELIAGSSSIDVSYWGGPSYGADALNDAMFEATTQNPYVFSRSWSVITVNGRAAAIEPVYVYERAEVEHRQSATLTAVSIALENTGASADDAAASALAIHDYIAAIATYDYDAAAVIESGGDDDSIAASQEAYGILVDGTAVCNGYAQAFQAIAQAAGLETVIVTGEAWSGATTGGHAWNRVLVDGTWLVVDATWDDAGDRYPVPHDFALLPPSDAAWATRSADQQWVVDAHLGDFGG